MISGPFRRVPDALGLGDTRVDEFQEAETVTEPTGPEDRILASETEKLPKIGLAAGAEVEIGFPDGRKLNFYPLEN